MLNFFRRSDKDISFVDNGIESIFVIFETSIDPNTKLHKQPCQCYDTDKHDFIDAKISIDIDVVLFVNDEVHKVYVRGTHFTHIEILDTAATVIISTISPDIVDTFHGIMEKYTFWNNSEKHVLKTIGTFIDQYKG